MTQRKSKAPPSAKSKTAPFRAIVECGPYQGFFGRAAYEPDDREYHGRVLGTRDVITFVAKDPQRLAAAFGHSVDDYLAFCAAENRPPEKAHTGKLIVRMPPEQHRILSALAERRGASLNTVIVEILARGVQENP